MDACLCYAKPCPGVPSPCVNHASFHPLGNGTSPSVLSSQLVSPARSVPPPPLFLHDVSAMSSRCRRGIAAVSPRLCSFIQSFATSVMSSRGLACCVFSLEEGKSEAMAVVGL